MTGHARAWLAATAWLLVMITVTSVPGSMVPDIPSVLPFRIDRVVHFGSYAMFGVLLMRALERRTIGRLLVVWLMVAVLGALDEWHQTLLPGRDAELADWLMDVLGNGTGLAAGTLLMRTRVARWLA